MKKKRLVFYFLVFVISISLLFVGALDFLNPFYEGLVNIGVFSNAQIYINSPLNTTYNFSVGQDYNLSLNVSSNFNLSSWKYSLRSLPGGTYVYTNISFTPNTSFNAVAKSNELIVFANDTGGNMFNKSVVFFVSVPNRNPIIGNISNEIFVCENNYLSYYFNVTDVDEDDVNVSISPINPFYVAFSSVINLTTNKYEIFSGTLSKSHAGGVNAGSKNYSETITASDGLASDSKNTNITIIEVNNAPAFDIGVQTIWTHGENSSFNYQVQVTDTEDGNQNSGNLNFNISFSGENLFNISSTGIMNFTANSSYIGVHNISVCVNDTGIDNPHRNISLCGQDGGSLTSCDNFSLTVTNQNRMPNITSYYSVNLSFNANGTDILYFNITASDADGTIPDAYWYVDDVLKEYDSGSLVNSFAHSFGCGISGAHTIKAEITDGELNASVQWNITVSLVSCPAGVSAGGGGGGGGGGIVACTPKWACEEWPQCKNLRNSFDFKEIISDYFFLIKERCSLFNWSDDFCGYQIRECNDFNLCKSNITKPGIIKECYYTEYPNCVDGIINCHDGGCEVLTDCGGPCKPCETCSDGIKNQNEENIDCGGSCPLCIEQPFKGLRWFVYVFLVAFIIILILIITSLIRLYRFGKDIDNIVSKRKGRSTNLQKSSVNKPFFHINLFSLLKKKNKNKTS